MDLSLLISSKSVLYPLFPEQKQMIFSAHSNFKSQSINSDQLIKDNFSLPSHHNYSPAKQFEDIKARHTFWDVLVKKLQKKQQVKLHTKNLQNLEVKLKRPTLPYQSRLMPRIFDQKRKQSEISIYNSKRRNEKQLTISRFYPQAKKQPGRYQIKQQSLYPFQKHINKSKSVSLSSNVQSNLRHKIDLSNITCVAFCKPKRQTIPLKLQSMVSQTAILPNIQTLDIKALSIQKTINSTPGRIQIDNEVQAWQQIEQNAQQDFLRIIKTEQIHQKVRYKPVKRKFRKSLTH